MDDMKAAFAGHMLTLSVSTLPQLDPKVLCSCPPRRSDGEQETATDIFSQSQGKTLCSGLCCEILNQLLYVYLHYNHSPSNPQTLCSEDKGALLPAGDKRWGLVIIYTYCLIANPQAATSLPLTYSFYFVQGRHLYSGETRVCNAQADELALFAQGLRAVWILICILQRCEAAIMEDDPYAGGQMESRTRLQPDGGH